MVNKIKTSNFSNLIGYNFRLGETEAAIGIEQLKKLPKILKKIQKNGELLNKELKKLEGLEVPEGDNKVITHAYYTYGLKLNTKKIKISRKKIVKMLRNLGVPCGEGYLNIHLLTLFKKKIAYGKKNYPWNLNKNRSYKYKIGDMPIAEDLHFRSYIGIGLTHYDFSTNDIYYIINAFQKVWTKLGLKIINDN